MARARSQFPTMNEMLSEMVVGKVTKGRGVRYVTSGRQPKPFPRAKGLITLDPDQLLSVRIPVQKIQEGDIKGYQQAFDRRHARDIAAYIQDPRHNYLDEFPVVEISVDHNGHAFVTDGQHRIGGAIIAYKPLRAVVTRRSSEAARRLFALQAKAKKPNANINILNSDDVYSEYIQDAVTNPVHPWHSLIAAGPKGTHTRMSATSALYMLQNYVGQRASSSRIAQAAIEAFDKDVADELADLLKCFGTPQTNPPAYSALGLRAIAMAARAVFRDNKPAEGDKARWMRHMPKFPFYQYMHIRSSAQLGEQLVRWWNRNLSPSRKIVL